MLLRNFQNGWSSQRRVNHGSLRRLRGAGTLRRVLLAAGLLLASSVVSAQVDENMSAGALKEHYSRIAKVPLYDHPELADYIVRIGRKVAANSDEPNTDFRFFIRDTPDTNAEAADYDLIYIDRGLLTHMVSEGQLAAVLAHEIGHRTGRHKERLMTKMGLGNFAEVLASIFAGNSGVGNAMGVANDVKLMEFKREVELEADELGSKYLYASGYEPTEMLGMLSILADVSALMSETQGINTAAYHGLFGSHPRNDRRRKAAIERAGVLPPGENFIGREEFREMMSGVVFGENYTGNKRPDQERYTNKTLGITFVYPNDWSQVVKGKNIVLKDADKTVQLKISIEKTVDKSLDSKQVLEAKYPDDLSKVAKIDEAATKDLGTVGRRPQQRVAVIQVGRNTFHFQGIARDNRLSDEQDAQMLEIIRSFRRASRADLSSDEVLTIYFQRLEPGETFAELAKNRILGKYTEEHLRVINGYYYPRSEPEPGTYIKMVERSEKDEDKDKESAPADEEVAVGR